MANVKFIATDFIDSNQLKKSFANIPLILSVQVNSLVGHFKKCKVGCLETIGKN